jgi:hypothetical protein
MTADLAYWWEYSPTTQEVVGSIPAQCKHLCTGTCQFVLGLGVSMYNMYVFTKKYIFKNTNTNFEVFGTSLTFKNNPQTSRT